MNQTSIHLTMLTSSVIPCSLIVLSELISSVSSAMAEDVSQG